MKSFNQARVRRRAPQSAQNERSVRSTLCGRPPNMYRRPHTLAFITRHKCGWYLMPYIKTINATDPITGLRFLMLTDEEHKLGWMVCPNHIINLRPEWIIKSFFLRKPTRIIVTIALHLSACEIECDDASHLPRKTNWIFIRVKVTSFHHKSIDNAATPKK